LQMAIYYLRLVHGIRAGYITLFQVSCCVIFFLMGLVLMHASLFLFLIAATRQKILLILGIGTMEVAISLGVLARFLSAKRWLRHAAKHGPFFEKLIHFL